MKQKLFAFVRPYTHPTPRVLKNMVAARNLGFRAEFWGAFRSPSIPKRGYWEGFPVHRHGIYYPESSLWYLIATPIYVLTIALKLFRVKPLLIHASDLEGVAACVLYRLFCRRSRLVLNIHDNFGARYNVPPFVKRILSGFEATLGKVADAVLIPDATRLEMLKPWVPSCALITPNTPPDPGYAEMPESPPIRILSAGWLMWTRGIRLLGELVTRIPEVELIVAGSGTQDVIDYVKGLPRTVYHGYLTQRQALEIGKSCHIVTALYDPSIEINRYASPNKIFDALALGRPVLINKETLISQEVEKWGCGFLIKYGDIDEIERLIHTLLRNHDLLQRKGSLARELYEKEFRWEYTKQKVMALFEDLAQR